MADTPELKIDKYHWITVVVTLSLDLAAPYMPAMGMTVPDGLQEGVRRTITQLRSEEIDPEISPAYALALIDWTRKQYGDRAAVTLYQWGSEVFNYGDHDSIGGSLFLWRSMMDHRGYRGHPPPPVAPPFIARLREILAEEPPLRVEDVPPMTAWDKEIYAWREYDLEIYTPMTSVSLTISDYRFRIGWATVRREMGPAADFATVKAWGFALAHEMGMPVENLGEPGKWADVPELSW